MLFAEPVTTTQLIGVGVVSLLFAFVMLWRARLVRRLRAEQASREPLHDRRETADAVERVTSHVERFELRLYDYSREVEARMQTRLAQLDRLVVTADREICRLQDLLRKNGPDAAFPGPDITTSASAAEARQAAANNSGEPLPTWQRRMMLHLSDAGYNTREIAMLLDRSEDEVAQALELERRLQSRGAA